MYSALRLSPPQDHDVTVEASGDVLTADHNKINVHPAAAPNSGMFVCWRGVSHPSEPDPEPSLIIADTTSPGRQGELEQRRCLQYLNFKCINPFTR